MSDRLKALLTAIVTYLNKKDEYVTKTKLLKLIYIFDVEFYRLYRRTFTGFDWKFFHLGPWTREFDMVLEELVSDESLSEDVRTRNDVETRFLRSNIAIDLRTPFDTYREEAVLKIVLDTWGSSKTGEILDYVYFRTEPMEHGIRHERLDFSRVTPNGPVRYERPSSGKTHSEIARLRRTFADKIATRASGQSFPFTEPNYDDQFRAAMEKLDSGSV